jgi:hypothetical protein
VPRNPRLAQAKNFGYLGHSISCPILHLTSGELIRIITADAYWKLFAKFFSGSRDVMKNKLDEIGTVRNSLAHFRPIKSDDVSLIKQNARHVLLVIEQTLTDLFHCASIVPSNSAAAWFKELRIVGTDACSLSFSQSQDETWIKIGLHVQCECLSANKSKEWVSYRVLSVVAPAILKNYPVLQGNVIFVTESVDYPDIPANLEPQFGKKIEFVFSRQCLESEHTKIKALLEKTLLKISEEAALIKEDNLARGELVELVSANARFQEGKPAGRWTLEQKNLKSRLSETDPPEFWGHFSAMGDENLVSDLDFYPWMPTDISRDPFF